MGKRIYKYNDKSDLFHYSPKNGSTISPTNTSMEYEIMIMRTEAKKNVDLVLGKNRPFDWRVALLRGIIYYYRLK